MVSLYLIYNIYMGSLGAKFIGYTLANAISTTRYDHYLIFERLLHAVVNFL